MTEIISEPFIDFSDQFPIIDPLSFPTNEGNFSVLSYNVAGLLEGLSQSKPSVFIPMISPLLNNYDLVLSNNELLWEGALFIIESPASAVSENFIHCS